MAYERCGQQEGLMEPEKKRENMAGGSADCTRKMRDEAEKKLARTQKISPRIKDQTPELLAHELHVHQIELGMLDEEIRRVHISLIRVWHKVKPDGVTIAFEDNGVGISVAKKEQIFFHGEGSRASVRALFFVREILDLTGITIRENGEPGKGARFEMVVPNGSFRNSPDIRDGTADKS